MKILHFQFSLFSLLVLNWMWSWPFLSKFCEFWHIISASMHKSKNIHILFNSISFWMLTTRGVWLKGLHNRTKKNARIWNVQIWTYQKCILEKYEKMMKNVRRITVKCIARTFFLFHQNASALLSVVGVWTRQKQQTNLTNTKISKLI